MSGIREWRCSRHGLDTSRRLSGLYRLSQPAEVEDEDSPSYRAWIDEVDPGMTMPLDHALLPVVFDIDV